jgi:hypothetical protein
MLDSVIAVPLSHEPRVLEVRSNSLSTIVSIRHTSYMTTPVWTDQWEDTLYYYWTPEWQKAEAEARADIRAGRVTKLHTLEEIEAHFSALMNSDDTDNDESQV